MADPNATDSRYAEFVGEVHPSLREHHIRLHALRQELLDSYVAIYEAAKNGHAVAAVDYSQVEERYNRKVEKLLADVKKDLPAIAKSDGQFGLIGHSEPANDDPFAPPSKDPPRWVVSPEELKGRVDDLLVRFNIQTLIPLGEHEKLTPKQEEAFTNYAVYDDALRKRFGKPPAKELDVAIEHLPREKVATTLLSHNPGLAITDIHVFGESMGFMADQAKAFKAANVDTFYVEDSQAHFDRYSRLSLEELKTLHKERKLGSIEMHSPRDEDTKDPEKTRLDNDGAYVEMLIAARENGIRVVRIDKDGAARETDLNMSHRIATTNMTWSERILADRKALADQGKPPGKFIVWGGMDHFVNSGDGRGRVDDVLGIPTIAFDKGNKNDPSLVRRGNGTYEADIYLPGGMQMMDARKHDNIGAVEEQLQMLRPLRTLHGVEIAIAALGAYKEALFQSMYDESDSVHAAKMKILDHQRTVSPPPPEPSGTKRSR